MKKIKSKLSRPLAAILLFGALTGSAQDYTWMKGTNLADQDGIYGTPGVSSALSNPGGREGAASWKDASGDFWIFGGLGYDHSGSLDYLGDLWKYTVSTNQWTFIKGDSVAYQPGVYGTMGTASALNKPGSRMGGASWTDASGNLWLFGGIGLDDSSNDGELNDLWKYTVSTNQWTWIRGTPAAYATAVYGTMGISSPSNEPGGSIKPATWVDASGNFWLFGGEGNDAVNYGDLDDLWKYNITTNEWTWIKGSASVDQNGVYGTQGISSSANNPGGRYVCANWADASGNLWIFGGLGIDATATTADFLNDQWKYNISTNEWTWMKGSTSANQPGAYGTQGASSPNTMPGCRIGPFSWKQNTTGDFYLFGGIQDFNTSITGDLNDLWKYSTITNEWTWLKGGNTSNVGGVYGTQGVSGPLNTPGARGLVSGFADNSNSLYLFGGLGITTGTTSYGFLNDVWKYTPCVAPSLTITSPRATICKGENVTLTASGASTYSWTSIPPSSGATLTVAPLVNSTYIVTGASASGCKNYALITQSVNACTGIAKESLGEAIFTVYPNPNKGSFTLRSSSYGDNSGLRVFNGLGQKVFEAHLESEVTELHTGLPQGVYFYQVINQGLKTGAGKFIVE